MVITETLFVIFGFYLLFQLLIGGLVIGIIANEDFVLFNPIQLYKKTKLNHIGAWMVGIGAGIIFPVLAIPYWIYKAFTVGK